MKPWLRWSAWLCLSLMFWTAAVEFTHTHPSPTEAATCSICVVAHSTSPAVSIAHDAPVFFTVDLLQEKSITAQARIDFSDLGIRGPPEVL